MADLPQLFYEDPDVIHNRMRNRLADLVDRPIEDSQPESLLLRTVAMDITMLRAQLDGGVASMLAQFSNFPMLNYVAGNAGVEQLGAFPAVTTLQFNLVPGHGTVVLPAGTKVRSTDGLMVFATDEEKSAAPGVDTITVTATALSDGPQGNLYIPGLITDIIDPYPFVASASNTVVTGGGADIETADGLRRRILISQNQYSTAGSEDSYRYWALSANPSIIDAQVVNELDEDGKPIGATVTIYPLVAGGGATPQAILDAVKEILSPKYRRPLNDIVEAESPTPVNYTIPLQLILKAGAVQSVTENAVIAAITTYVTNQSKQLGADITESQIKAAGMNGSVHSLLLPGFTDKIIGPTEFAVCTEISKVGTTYEDPNAG